MDEEFIEEIRQKFELNQYEVKIWLSLLTKGISSAGEISTESNVPRSRAYDVLESLEKKGFIMLKNSKPIKYLAVDPEDIIENFKKNILNKASKQAEKIAEFKTSEVFSELSQYYNKGIKMLEPTELSGLVKGRNNIYNQINNMIKNSTKTVTLSASLNDLNNFSQFKNELTKANKRGVIIKMVAPKNDMKFINSSINELGELKNQANDFSRFIITDDSNMLFLMANDEEIHPKHDLGLWLKSPSFAKSINVMFNHMWERLN
ncbi:MAG: helix-turn-helix domain-containing protein [Candidatus Nanoarchaeia archaeon]|jgi:sugar-specific transcriptional regulator TrmB